MKWLFADRFVCDTPAAVGRTTRALDLATGADVRLRIREAGPRVDQQTWTEACARAHAAGALVDYGFIGRSQKFEATVAHACEPRGSFRVPRADVLAWLELRRPSSASILTVPTVPDPRSFRVRGFVPMSVSFIDAASMKTLWPLLKGRSIVLLAPSRSPVALSFAFLDSRRAQVHDACAITRDQESRSAMVKNAAEGRAAYDPAPRVRDACRAGGLLAEGERLFAAGRHAAAERAFRSAAGAFHRRDDSHRAACADMSLGRLMLTRGRSAAARESFESAYQRFHRMGAAVPAISATVHVGLAEADSGLMMDAERSCRSAHSAAAALGDRSATATAVIALARICLWLERHSEAEALLDSITTNGLEDELVARYWCLIARIHLTCHRYPDAWHALEQARPPAGTCHPAVESLVRRWEAAVQARVGDLNAVTAHVTAGLAAARAAHLPLRAWRLRFVLVDGLIGAGKTARARTAASRLQRLGGVALPPLLKGALKRTFARLDAAERPHPVSNSKPTVRERAASFQPYASSQTLSDLEKVADLLARSHQLEDETEALVRAASLVQRHLHACNVGIFGCVNREARPFGSAGTPDSACASRCVNAGIAIGPEASDGWVDAAVPIRYLGKCVGALTIRWTVEGPDQQARALAFAAAAAGACAPLVYVLVERQAAPRIDSPYPDLIGVSSAMEAVHHAIARAANAPFTVLIEGESGSGKELVARAIHGAGSRRERRFCAFNCAAMADELVDTELFGHTKGAFTGATGDRLGLFESADHGTVFLDEVGELSLRAQAKILRVLQEGEVRRIGENFNRPFDARLIAATNRALRAEVDAGRFRQDLLYRLDVIRIRVPPLRERVEDIPMLAVKFWRQSAERIGSKAVLGQSALSALARYDWPGNVRELQNVLSALVVASPARGVVGAGDLPQVIARSAPSDPQESLESARLKFEQRFVRAALARAAGHRGRTAAALGLSRQGLAKLMQRLHLDA